MSFFWLLKTSFSAVDYNETWHLHDDVRAKILYWVLASEIKKEMRSVVHINKNYVPGGKKIVLHPLQTNLNFATMTKRTKSKNTMQNIETPRASENIGVVWEKSEENEIVQGTCSRAWKRVKSSIIPFVCLSLSASWRHSRASLLRKPSTLVSGFAKCQQKTKKRSIEWISHKYL